MREGGVMLELENMIHKMNRKEETKFLAIAADSGCAHFDHAPRTLNQAPVDISSSI